MAMDDRLESAKHAVAALVDRLDSDDRFGLVCFDDEVQVTVAAGPVADKAALKARIAGSSRAARRTCPAACCGGCRRRGASPRPSRCRPSCCSATGWPTPASRTPGTWRPSRPPRPRPISTVGIGLGYDETLLAAVARGGRGNHTFAEAADEAGRRPGGRGRGAAEQDRAGGLADHPPDRRRRRGGGPQRPAVPSRGRRDHGRGGRPVGRRAPDAAARPPGPGGGRPRRHAGGRDRAALRDGSRPRRGGR
jgi:hypothetical protein